MEKYCEIALEKITPSHLNPRKYFDPEKMKELAASIKAKGIVQPVLVRPVKDKFELVCGERRFRAAGMVELKSIPAIIRDLDDQDVLEIQIIENLQRAEIHPMEEAEGYFTLSRRPGCDVAKISEKTGRSVKYVYDRIKLLSLTKKAKELFLANKFTAGHAILLARLAPARQDMALDPDNHAVFAWENVTDDLYLLPGDPKTGPITKPRSVRELQIWIDDNVRFDRDKVDPMLFPETVMALSSAKDNEEKIIPITADNYVQTSARSDERIVGPRSWKSADGKSGAKMCEHSVTGVFVAGPGRGEALKVCVAKEKCKIHWGEWQKEREAKLAAPIGGEKQTAKKAQAEAKKRQEFEIQRKAWKDRFEKARPKIYMAFSDAVEKLPATANGVLADILVSEIKSRSSLHKKVCIARGKTAEDLIRYLVHLMLCESAIGWDAVDDCPKIGKLVGVDINKIVTEAVPEKPTGAAEINREKAEAKKK